MLLTLWEAFFLTMGVVALLILAAVSLVVCDYVIRKAVRDVLRTRALCGLQARQRMEARRKRWEKRRAEGNTERSEKGV